MSTYYQPGTENVSPLVALGDIDLNAAVMAARNALQELRDAELSRARAWASYESAVVRCGSARQHADRTTADLRLLYTNTLAVLGPVPGAVGPPVSAASLPDRAMTIRDAPAQEEA